MGTILTILYGFICFALGFIVCFAAEHKEMARVYQRKFQEYLNAELNLERAWRKRAEEETAEWKRKYYTEIQTNLT